MAATTQTLHIIFQAMLFPLALDTEDVLHAVTKILATSLLGASTGNSKHFLPIAAAALQHASCQRLQHLLSMSDYMVGSMLKCPSGCLLPRCPEAHSINVQVDPGPGSIFLTGINCHVTAFLMRPCSPYPVTPDCRCGCRMQQEKFT